MSRPSRSPNNPETRIPRGATDIAAQIVRLREINRPHLVNASAALVGDEIIFSWDFTPVGETMVENPTTVEWRGVVMARNEEGPSDVNYPGEQPLLFEHNQPWPPQSDDGDIRLHNLRVVKKPRGFGQRSVLPPGPLPSKSVLPRAPNPARSAPAILPHIDTERPASKYFVPLIASAVGYQPTSYATATQWTNIRDLIGAVTTSLRRGRSARRMHCRRPRRIRRSTRPTA